MTDLDDDTAARLQLIVSPEALAATGLELVNLVDPDARSIAIRADHPELDHALADGRDSVTVGGEPMNIRLHLAMHEIVANQLADGDPPEVYETAKRLLAAGYDRHEVLHMLARPMASQIHVTLADQQPYDQAQHVAALRALPASWERERAQRQLESSHRRRPHRRKRRR
jgi:hypothetical protein